MDVGVYLVCDLCFSCASYPRDILYGNLFWFRVLSWSLICVGGGEEHIKYT